MSNRKKPHVGDLAGRSARRSELAHRADAAARDAASLVVADLLARKSWEQLTGSERASLKTRIRRVILNRFSAYEGRAR